MLAQIMRDYLNRRRPGRAGNRQADNFVDDSQNEMDAVQTEPGETGRANASVQTDEHAPEETDEEAGGVAMGGREMLVIVEEHQDGDFVNVTSREVPPPAGLEEEAKAGRVVNVDHVLISQKRYVPISQDLRYALSHASVAEQMLRREVASSSPSPPWLFGWWLHICEWMEHACPMQRDSHTQPRDEDDTPFVHAFCLDLEVGSLLPLLLAPLNQKNDISDWQNLLHACSTAAWERLLRWCVHSLCYSSLACLRSSTHGTCVPGSTARTRVWWTRARHLSPLALSHALSKAGWTMSSLCCSCWM